LQTNPCFGEAWVRQGTTSTPKGGGGLLRPLGITY
jgi:hypothetical protein